MPMKTRREKAMKKHIILLVVSCVSLTAFAATNAGTDQATELRPTEVIDAAIQGRAISPLHPLIKADVRKLDFRGIAPMRDIVLDEADYEPNDWDGYTWPPSPWDGLIGVLPSMEAVTLNGALDSTGFSGGWYSGDTDLFGFSLPDEGILDITIEFSPDCSDDNIYNVWFLGEAIDGMLYILDMNFPYPSIAPVTCPFEGSYTIDPFGEIEPGIYLANDFYIYIGGPDGEPPSYTITWFFSDCSDQDGDGYYPEACGGADCDDQDPSLHPCALDAPDDVIDQDCSGSDRTLGPGEISEEEPNDSEGEAQDLGALAMGACFEIEANFCTVTDADHYLLDLPATDIMLTLTETFGGVTGEIACLAFEGMDDYWFSFLPTDLDEDGLYDVGDYHLSICANPALDADGDGRYSDATCGDDCDDSDPEINPCDPEAPAECSDGIDQDCTGIEATLSAEGLWPGEPDLDLDCDGTWEIEPNDDIYAGIVHDLGRPLPEGITTVYGDLSSIGYDEGDYDFYQFELPSEGFIFFQLMFDCENDYDIHLLAYYDPDGPGDPFYEPDWYIIESDAWIYAPEMVGGDILEEGGWEFPLPMAVWVLGYDGDPGYYYLETYYDRICFDADGDGYEDDVCGGTDCDDTDSEVNPGADETCDNGIDDDCDGLVDRDDPDCPIPFKLKLEAFHRKEHLRMHFILATPEPAMWSTYLILTHPTVHIIQIWSLPVRAIDPPAKKHFVFPFPSIRWIGIYSVLFTEGGIEASDFKLAYTGVRD